MKSDGGAQPADVKLAHARPPWKSPSGQSRRPALLRLLPAHRPYAARRPVNGPALAGVGSVAPSHGRADPVVQALVSVLLRRLGELLLHGALQENLLPRLVVPLLEDDLAAQHAGHGGEVLPQPGQDPAAPPPRGKAPAPRPARRYLAVSRAGEPALLTPRRPAGQTRPRGRAPW